MWRSLNRKNIKFFNVYSNQHVRADELVQGKQVVYDANYLDYDNLSQAYLLKRWTKKSEICKHIDQIQKFTFLNPFLRRNKTQSNKLWWIIKKIYLKIDFNNY